MVNENKLTTIFEEWINNPENKGNITHLRKIEEKTGKYTDFPEYLHSDLQKMLINNGISYLYSHQSKAITLINTKNNVVITSGPSSGKSLIYLIPILNELFYKQKITTLLLFPTKALAYDQHKHISQFISNSGCDLNTQKSLLRKINVYDGDTPQELRSTIRKNSQIILTNPDMLHFGILPNHQLWEPFLEELKFVVLDEAHIYNGIFGSHVANVLRRLRRIETFYNRKIIFICTTATIGNPEEHLQKMIEDHFHLISEDGAPNGRKSIIFYNPPIINQELGIRKSAYEETLRLAEDFSVKKIQTLIFQGSRKAVEKSIKIFKSKSDEKINRRSTGYRSGYLAEDRRTIEEQFRTGKILTLFSTNALELGVDIGGLQCVIISGYPGTISSTRQQIGRSGRSSQDSLAIFIASSYPIDQYIIKRPEYLLLKNPEHALTNPDNPNILIDHILLSLNELSFIENENFGSIPWSQIKYILDQFVEQGLAIINQGKYSFNPISTLQSPISIRNINGNKLKLIEEIDGVKTVIGEIDYLSSFWMVHPNAIYLHLADQYFVSKLDLEKNKVLLTKSNSNYYTEPKINKEYRVINEIESYIINDISLSFGKIKITQQVVGYKEILWDTNQKIGEFEIELPKTEMETEAFWFFIPDKIKNQLIKDNLWLNFDNDYGPLWDKYKNLIRKRDNFTCQVCGIPEENTAHHIHHIKPIKLFDSIELANNPSNLTTLCPKCHRMAEVKVRVKSGLAGLAYLLKTLSPVFVMCSPNDIDVLIDSKNNITGNETSILIYDNIPYGMGLSRNIFTNFTFIVEEIYLHAKSCGCSDGCPSCVGPVSEEGYGGKEETIRMLELILRNIHES